MAKEQPAGRVGNPMDKVHMVLFLCGEKVGFITGENICIDGGMTRQIVDIEKVLLLFISTRYYF